MIIIQHTSTPQILSYMRECKLLWFTSSMFFYVYRYETDKLQFIFLFYTWSKLWARAKRRLELI